MKGRTHSNWLTRAVLTVHIAMICSVGMAQEGSKVQVTGRVVDDSTQAPIVNANVFIANSMIGTSSDTSGVFVLRNVPIGFHELVASCVGYSMATVRLQLIPGADQRVEMHLVPKELSISVVEVTGQQPEVWKANLKIFEGLLLGKTDEASECRITNPEVLDFSTDPPGHFSARTDHQVTVENLATGYRLHMSLGIFSFDGRWLTSEYKIRFEEIRPLDPENRVKWREQREKVYSGSLRHFLVSLVNNDVSDEGFAMYETESLGRVRGDMPLYELKRYNILKQSSATEWTLSFPHYLVVTYDRKQVAIDGNPAVTDMRRLPAFRTRSMRPQLSILTLPKGPVLLDPRGQILNQLALKISGDWAKEGLANQLPIEFQPGEGK
jgi:hypothetical protein